jgi:hypothetical protein
VRAHRLSMAACTFQLTNSLIRQSAGVPGYDRIPERERV